MIKTCLASTQRVESVMGLRKCWLGIESWCLSLSSQVCYPLLPCASILAKRNLTTLTVLVCVCFFVCIAGPTSFAPIIEMAMSVVEKSSGQYHVLVIIADGQVCTYGG